MTPTKTSAFAFALATASFLAVGIPHSASAQAISNNPITLQAQHSNKCVDVAGASQNEGAEIIQYGCKNSKNQHWLFDFKGKNSSGSERYALKAHHSGKCLALSGNANMAPVVQQSCNGSDSQLWQLDMQNGEYRLMNVAVGKCLDVSGASKDDVAKLIGYQCNGQANQTFVLTRAN